MDYDALIAIAAKALWNEFKFCEKKLFGLTIYIEADLDEKCGPGSVLVTFEVNGKYRSFSFNPK
jgi:hypothetical protein